jgi:Asp/Glu/hydantoin racemase
MVDASTEAPLVVCTCSTIGGAAEQVSTEGRFAAARIDRAMADRAVQAGARILLVAALESTLGPTDALIRDSARKAGKEVHIRNLVLTDAWQHFLAGESERFAAEIERAVRRDVGNADMVVLAQASMAPAQAKLANLGVDVLSSPKLGVEAAVRLLRDMPRR